MKNLKADIVIIGAGAAGLMAAYFCSKKGKKVVVLEHNDRVGRKILISGGGRCNFTNIHSNPLDFDSKNPDFCKPALSKFTPQDFLKMVKQDKISFYEKKLGQLFCKNSAKDINTLLLRRIHQNKAQILLNQKDLSVSKEEHFKIANKEMMIESEKLVIATGGLSIPTIGASDFGHKVAKQFGHKLIHTEPALVPFKMAGYQELAGTALVAKLTCNGHSITEDVLFTHKGLSGPGILKISLYWKPKDELSINWLPDSSPEKLLNILPGKSSIRSVLRSSLPNKFVDFMLAKIGISVKAHFKDLSKVKKEELLKLIFNMSVIPDGTEGFRKAEVTRGGVDTLNVSPKTMESLKEPGLYFIGEVLDVTGQLGGHNFQWAWASAFAAGEDLK